MKDDIAISNGKFGFNPYNVCLTPNIPIEWKKGASEIIIKTAHSPNGRWDRGFRLSCGNGGSGSPVALIRDNKDGFSTEKEAIMAALDCAESFFRRYKDDSALRQIEIFRERFNPKQLELF